MDGFSQTYDEARDAFREAAKAVGANIQEYRIDVPSYAGTLAIDVACFGHAHPNWSLVVSSGLHGVEGFFGSAVQLSYLRSVLGTKANALRGRYVFIHALNPFGFSALRRANEDNVDLNRNFLLPGEAYSGVSDSYARLNSFLNPAYPPGKGDFYSQSTLENFADGVWTIKAGGCRGAI